MRIAGPKREKDTAEAREREREKERERGRAFSEKVRPTKEEKGGCEEGDGAAGTERRERRERDARIVRSTVGICNCVPLRDEGRDERVDFRMERLHRRLSPSATRRESPRAATERGSGVAPLHIGNSAL